MSLDQIQKGIYQYTCCLNDHEDQDIVGYCMLYECQDPSAICVRCVTIDKIKYHKGHQHNCLKGFKDIIKILDQGMIKIQLEQDGFKDLYELITEGKNYIQKILLKQSENLIPKIERLKKKINVILEKIIQRKQLFAYSKESLAQKNYKYFRDNIKQVQKTIQHQQNYNSIGIITSIKIKYEKLFQKLKNEVEQNDFIKNIIHSDLFGLKMIYNNKSQDRLLQEVKNYFDQALILNSQLTLAQIRKALEELERLYNASLFDDQNNRIYFNDLINQESVLICKDQDENALNLLDEIIRVNPDSQFSQCIKCKLLEMKSNYESSIKYIDRAIQLDLNNAKFYNNKGDQKIIIGIFLHQFGEFEDSIKQFDQAIELNPKNPVHYINKGISLIQLGDSDDSILHFNQAIILEAINPSQFLTLHLQVISKYTLGMNSLDRNYKKIEEFPLMLSQQSLSKPDDADNYIDKGNSLQTQGNYLDSILFYDLTIMLKPDYAAAYNQKGYSLHQLQRYGKASKCYEEAIRLQPNNAQYYYNMGNSLEKLQKHQDALKFYNEAINLQPKYGEFYNKKGEVLQKLEQFEEAQKCYYEAILLKPNYADQYKTSKGLALEKLEQYKENNKQNDVVMELKPDQTLVNDLLCIQCCEKTIQFNQNNSEFDISKANTLKELPKDPKKINFYDDQIRLQSEEVIKTNKEQALQKSKQYLDAIKFENQNIKLKPYDSCVFNKKGDFLQELSQQCQAILCYEAMNNVQPNYNYADYQYNKGLALFQLQKYQDANLCFDRAIRQKANYYNITGMVLTKLQLYGDAIPYFDEAIKLNEELDFYQNNKSNQSTIEKYKHFNKYYDKVLSLTKDVDYYNELGQTLHKQQQYENAIERYNEAIRLKPDEALGYSNKSTSLHQLQKYQEAIECYDQAIRLDPNDFANHFNKGKYFINNYLTANTLHQLQQYINAIICYDEAIRLNPNNTIFFIKKGDTLQKLEEHQNAIQCYDQAIILQPDNAVIYNYKGYSLHELQQYQQAISCYDKAISLKPTDADYYYNKGLALHELQQYQNAIICYDQAISLKSSDADFYIEKGYILQKLQQHQDAIKCFDQAIQINSDNAVAYKNKGQSLNEQCKYLDAIKSFNQALKLDPLQPQCYYEKANSLGQLTMFKQALICYRIIFEFFPGDSALSNQQNLMARI